LLYADDDRGGGDDDDDDDDVDEEMSEPYDNNYYLSDDKKHSAGTDKYIGIDVNNGECEGNDVAGVVNARLARVWKMRK